jgi:hypothetical protein
MLLEHFDFVARDLFCEHLKKPTPIKIKKILK